MQLDVGDEASWREAVAWATGELGRIDCLVNNAGIYRTTSIAETSLEMYEAIVRINQIGTFLGMRSVLPAMAVQGGSIVNISSTSALKGNQNSVACGHPVGVRDDAPQAAGVGLQACLELLLRHARRSR